MASTQKSRDLKSGKRLIAFLIVLLCFVVFAKINGAFGNEDIHGVKRLLEHFFVFLCTFNVTVYINTLWHLVNVISVLEISMGWLLFRRAGFD